MRRLVNLFTAVSLVLIPIKIFAAPDASLWRSVNILGANKTHYYVLVSERTHPGSYYEYRERVFIEKHIIKLNRKVFSAVISDIQYTIQDPEKDIWQAKTKPSNSFDLAGYFAKEKIAPLYPELLDRNFRILYKQDGLHLARNNKSILLRPLGKSRLVFGEDIGVPGIYFKSGFLLLKISQGDQTIDQDYLEMVLPISLDKYRKVKKQLSPTKK